MRWACGLFFLIAVLLMSFGCSVSPPRPPSLRQPALTHTVTYRGETLGLISKWYTGESKNWKIIAQLNPGISAVSLRLGDVIVVPAELIVNRKSLPRPRKDVQKIAKSRARLRADAVIPDPAIKKTSLDSKTDGRNSGEEASRLLPQVGAIASRLFTQLQPAHKVVTCHGGKCFLSNESTE